MNVSEMAKMGGKASAKKRFEGLSKEEISEKMRKLRYSKEELKEMDEMGDEILENLRKNTREDTSTDLMSPEELSKYK